MGDSCCVKVLTLSHKIQFLNCILTIRNDCINYYCIMTNTKMPISHEFLGLLLDLVHLLSTGFWLNVCDLRRNELFCYKFYERSILLYQPIWHFVYKFTLLLLRACLSLKNPKNARFHFKLICHFFTFLILPSIPRTKIFAWE